MMSSTFRRIMRMIMCCFAINGVPLVYTQEELINTAAALALQGTVAVAESTNNKKEQAVAAFLKPVMLTHSGLDTFFRHTYNHEQYGMDFLPCSFMHVDDFLFRIKSVDNPAVYACMVLSLFDQKLKESLWVNPYACAELLSILKKNIPFLVSLYQQRCTQDIKTIIHDALLVDFDVLRQDPESFIDKLAHSIIEQQEVRKRTDIAEQVARLLEHACEKLVWNPRESLETWEVCKQIGNVIYTLKTEGCIANDDRLNQIIWSLVVRYVHFIKTVGMYLPIDVIDTIAHECADESKAPGWLCIAERERLIVDKRHMLCNALQAVRVQALAYAQGMWVE